MKQAHWLVLTVLMVQYVTFCTTSEDINEDFDLQEFCELQQQLRSMHEDEAQIKGDQRKTNIWTQPLIIDHSNDITTYTFTENVTYKPVQNYVYPVLYSGYPAAIIINKDNVIINFAGFNLNLDPTSGSNFLINNPVSGISILPGVKNIKIISSTLNQPSPAGVIAGFSGYAIYMLGAPQILNSYDIYANYIKNIKIDNMTCSYNLNGIYSSYALSLEVTNSNILYNFSPRPSYGIYFSTVQFASVENCNVSKNWSYDTIKGIFFQDTIHSNIVNCKTNVQQSLKSGNCFGIHIAGTSPGASYGNTVDSCIANGNTCPPLNNRASAGIIMDTSKQNTISQCETILNAIKTSQFFPIPSPGIPHGYGIWLTNSQNNQIVQNKCDYNLTAGFYDDLSISTSLYRANIASFNPTNYNITTLGQTGPIALPTIVLYQDTINTYTQQIYANIEFQLRT